LKLTSPAVVVGKATRTSPASIEPVLLLCPSDFENNYYC